MIEWESNLHLSLGLSLGEDGVETGGLHDVTRDLELALHEQVLGLGGTLDELAELSVGGLDGDCEEEESVIVRTKQRADCETYRQASGQRGQDHGRRNPRS